MIHIYQGQQQPQHAELFRQLHRRRHEVFIEGRGWSLPRKNGLEIDQYDGADAIYVIDLADDGQINGSVRINRTDQGSLSADLFPHLFADEHAVTGVHIFEATRYFVAPHARNPKLVRRLRCELVVSALEYVQAQGGSQLRTVIDAQMLPAFLEMSARIKVLGGAHPYGGGKHVPGGGECLLMSANTDDATINDVRGAADLSQQNARATATCH